LGELARIEGDYDRAAEAYEECLNLCREIGNKQREAFAIGNLGLVDQHRGDYELAESRMIESLILCNDLNSKYPIAMRLAFLSGPAAARGNPERAAQLLGASDALLKAMGLGLQVADQPEIDRYEAAARERLDEEAFKSAWKKGQAMSLEQATAFALEEETE
jgi:non-specific serine/threonine protein kinase